MATANNNDINLYLDYYTVAGSTVQAEDSANWIDRGSGLAAFDGNDILSANNPHLYWNAALRRIHYSNPSVDIVKRSTFSFAGIPILQKVAGDPTSSNNGDFFIYTDHLGTPATLVDGNFTVQSRQRYYPFGETRTDSGADLTSRGFTGHVENRGIGLTYMNARFYAPYLNRKLTADTIVPDPSNPQSFNRYSYVLNNPVNFTDPTGHYPVSCRSEFYGGGGGCPDPLVTFSEADGENSEWTVQEKTAIISGAHQVNNKLKGHGGTFLDVYGGPVNIYHDSQTCNNALGYDCWASATGSQVTVYANAGSVDSWLIMHELGHSFNANTVLTEDDFWGEGYKNLAQEGIYAPDGSRIAGNTNPVSYSDNSTYQRTDFGYQGTALNPYPYRQHADALTVEEDFADMFMNYVNNSFTTDDAGVARYNWMDSHMSTWITIATRNNQ